ncbi:MAG: flagellar protein FliS [Clostridiales bacterium]|jgi:flagellin-specific chaperone FliS|nr:flagellar protein FliS [Clostridiales bacterium]
MKADKTVIDSLRGKIISVSGEPALLNLVNFDIILDYLRFAAISAGSGEWTDFREDVGSALRFLDHLIASLDGRREISETLRGLYLYCENILQKSMATDDPAPVCEAARILGDIRGAFAEASRSAEFAQNPVNSKEFTLNPVNFGEFTLNPVNSDSQYYGLTYDKHGRPSEPFAEPGEGYRA